MQVPVLLALGVFALFLMPSLMGLTFLGLDFHSTAVSNLCQIQEACARDSLKLSPFLGKGQPLYANLEAQLFYPLRQLFLWLPPETAANCEVALSMALAALGTFFLARSFRLKNSDALAASLVFVLCGTTLDLVRHAFYLSGAVALPWAWLGIRRIIDGGRKRNGYLMLTVALVLVVFGADVQTALSVGLIGAVEIAWSGRKQGPRVSLKNAAKLLASALVAALIVCVQILPALAEMRLGEHVSGLQGSSTSLWAFEARYWPNLFWPGLVTEPLRWAGNLNNLFQSSGTMAPWTSPLPWNPSPYLGFIVLGLASLGLGKSVYRSVLFVFAGFLLLSLGSQGIFHDLLGRLVPPFSWFRYPMKYLLPASLGVSLLAAGGLRAFLDGNSVFKRRFLLMLSGIGALNLSLVLLSHVQADALNSWVQEKSKDWPVYFPDDALTLSELLERSLLHPLLFLTAFACVAFLSMKRKRLEAFLGFVMIGDLLLAGLSSLQIGPKLIHRDMPVLEKDPGPTAFYCHDASVRSSVIVPKGDGSPQWWQIFTSTTLGAPNTLACRGRINATPYGSLDSAMRGKVSFVSATGKPGPLWALGCDILISARHQAPPSFESVRLGTWDAHPAYRGIFKGFRSTSPMPEVFTLAGPRWMKSERELLQEILNATKASDVYSLIDDPLGRTEQVTLANEASRLPRVESFKEGPESFTIRVSGKGYGLLVVKRLYAVGWSAKTRDRNLPVVRVAGNFLGVLIDDAVEGNVELAYSLPSGSLALVLSALGLLLGALGLWFVGRRP